MRTDDRRRFVDWARGVAVLVMIGAHVFDAWTLPVERGSVTYRNLMILGGFAAPLFLWLAGFTAVLSAERALGRTGDRPAAMVLVCRRGLVVFLLAFLFRMQSFIVSPGNSLLSLFRVDILNIMGPSIVATGLVWGLCRRRASLVAAFTGLTVALAMLTPVVRSADWVAVLPTWIQWHLRPSGEFTVFTVFPWSGFTLGGAAVGAVLAMPGRQVEQRLHRLVFGVGGLVTAFGFYAASLPTIYEESHFWTSSPTFFAIRTGLLMMVFSVLFFVEILGDRVNLRLEPLQKMGQRSLFVYWIHVELVYGYASWPLRRHLTLPQAALGYLAFCALMYGAVLMRDRVAGRSRQRKLGGTAQIAPA